MWLSRDRRPWKEQAASGVRIAAAFIATFAALVLIAVAYMKISNLDGGHNVVAGWLLMSAVVAVLSMTVQYWCRWFYFLPGYVALRMLFWTAFGWFSPRGFILVFCPILMAIMAVLSFRYDRLKKIHPSDRIILMLTLGCFLGSLAGLFANQPKVSALLFVALGDMVLLVRWVFVRQQRGQQRRKVEAATALPASGR